MNNQVRKIRKYQNRKLYDLSASSYVTLNKLADLLTKGESFLVLENGTEKDITTETLLQILVQRQKNSGIEIPSDMLRNMMISYLSLSGYEPKQKQSLPPVAKEGLVSNEGAQLPEEELGDSFWSE